MSQQRKRAGQLGRTLPELIVAAAILVTVTLILAGAQITTFKWYRADQRAADVVRPVRDAVDYLARDVEIATSIAVTNTNSRLELTQKKQSGTDITEYTVHYWLDGDQLMREETPDGGTAQTRVVVRGLSYFYVDAVKDDPTDSAPSRARVVLRAKSSADNSVQRELDVELVSRMEVAQ